MTRESPYIFLLCAEGLSLMVHNVERTWPIKGVSVGKVGISFNYLLFADDCILFL